MTDESIFAEALGITDPAARAAFLDRACAGNAELRRQVEALLAAHAAGSPLDRPLDRPPESLARTGAYVPAVAAHGDRVGPYKLIEPIGEGGMGEVWMAEQTEPVKRRVALKLIKPGMDSRAVLARFEAERQALALMDHPHIAKVFDAGATTDGRPYFVMELVKGTPITKFCDEKRLNPRERLELFVQACQAIQHAHQKGIIHRDVKPSNVLVALYDDQPVVKVIDFGVAKATGQPLTDKTLATGFNAVVGTPQYMSPEQATLNNLDIDTRSDVYSLGVLLYELLAGSPPFSRKELEQQGLMEVLRVVREEEPPRPSTKLSTADALPSLSANRNTEPRALTALLRGELDWIVMKALEKDRTRRYETTNGFAADVLRFLNGEPVQAHPPSTAYRLKKFVRKYRGPVAAATAVLLALVGGAAAVSWGLVHALDAEARATKDRDDAVLARNAESEALGKATAARIEAERLAAGAIIDAALATAPEREDEQLLHLCRLANRLPESAREHRQFAALSALVLGQKLYPPFLFSLDGTDNPPRLAPDRLTAYTCSPEKTTEVRLWDAATGKLRAVLGGHAGEILRAEYKAGGRWLVTLDEEFVVRVWEVATGRLHGIVRGMNPHPDDLQWGLSVSPTGDRILHNPSSERGVTWAGPRVRSPTRPLATHRGRERSAGSNCGTCRTAAGSPGTARL